jgi:N-acetyltransferase 10
LTCLSQQRIFDIVTTRNRTGYLGTSLVNSANLRNTFGMLVLQDFEALRPNLLARTIETVQGGGMICILLKSMTSLKQLYTLTMVSTL